MLNWKQPKKIFSLNQNQLGAARSVSEIVRASVSAPAKPTGGHAKLQPSALEVARRPEPTSEMDRLVDQLEFRAKAMIKTPSEYTRRRFYDTADAILKTGNGLPASATLINAGLSKKLILRGLVKRGYMASYQGPSRLQLRAQRAVSWFQARSSVPAAFIRRGEHDSEGAPPGGTNAQYEDCRATLCPEAGPNDLCEECDELQVASQLRSVATGAVIIKSDTGGIRARTDGQPVRYDSIGRRIA